jgi:hypothetical protein
MVDIMLNVWGIELAICGKDVHNKKRICSFTLFTPITPGFLDWGLDFKTISCYNYVYGKRVEEICLFFGLKKFKMKKEVGIFLLLFQSNLSKTNLILSKKIFASR